MIPHPSPRSVEALLACERAIVDKPEALKVRVLARAQESLCRGDVAALEVLGSPIWTRVLLTAAGSVAVLATVATALHFTKHRRTGDQEGTVRAAPAKLSPAPVADELPAAEILPDPPAVSAPAIAVAPLPARKHTDVFEELRLLDRARQSDARGEYASVLTIANDHARNYPDGRLAEEREVLRLKALVSLGRAREARHAAGDFRRQFPRSVLLPTIEAMLATLR